jgi:hypothetical protein
MPHSYSVVVFPYCTSDDFAGNASQTATGWSFMGARVVPAVVQTLKVHTLHAMFEDTRTRTRTHTHTHCTHERTHTRHGEGAC